MTVVSTPAPDTTVKNTSQPTLPPIPLPLFIAIYDGWASFKNQIETTVRDWNLQRGKVSVSGTVCFHGPVDSLIKNLATTDENYQVARKMLEDEFKNDRLHLKTLLTRVVECKSFDEKHLTHLRAFYSTLNETSQSMTAQGWIVENGMWHH